MIINGGISSVIKRKHQAGVINGNGVVSMAGVGGNNQKWASGQERQAGEEGVGQMAASMA